MNVLVFVVVGVLLFAALWTDIRRMQIPNGLTVFFACGGVLYQVIMSDMKGVGWALAGALAGIIPLYIMHKLGGIGGGDVKLFGAVGLWLGPAPTFMLLILSILYAGGIACALLFLRLPGIRKLGERLKWPWGPHPLTAGRGVQIPFMLAVAPGFITLIGKG